MTSNASELFVDPAAPSAHTLVKELEATSRMLDEVLRTETAAKRMPHPIIQAARALVDQMLAYPESDFLNLPLGYLDGPVAAVQAFKNHLVDMSGRQGVYDDQVLSRLRVVWKAMSQDLALPVCILAVRSTKVAKSLLSIDSLVVEADDAVQKIRNEAASIAATITKEAGAKTDYARGQMDALVVLAKNAVDRITALEPTAAVGAHQKRFAAIAMQHQDDAGAWLKATGGAAAVILIVAIIVAFWWPVDADKVYPAIGALASRAVLLSVLYYGAVVCLKNYRAHRHLAVVNQMRANSLGTFQAFTKAAGADETTKNAVLLAATSAIFSQTATGYSLNDADPSRAQLADIAKLGKS